MRYRGLVKGVTKWKLRSLRRHAVVGRDTIRRARRHEGGKGTYKVISLGAWSEGGARVTRPRRSSREAGARGVSFRISPSSATSSTGWVLGVSRRHRRAGLLARRRSVAARVRVEARHGR